jgi:hypothetical protein
MTQNVMTSAIKVDWPKKNFFCYFPRFYKEDNGSLHAFCSKIDPPYCIIPNITANPRTTLTAIFATSCMTNLLSEPTFLDHYKTECLVQHSVALTKCGCEKHVVFRGLNISVLCTLFYNGIGTHLYNIIQRSSPLHRQQHKNNKRLETNTYTTIVFGKYSYRSRKCFTVCKEWVRFAAALITPSISH